jgi:hypothetical protein
MIALALFPILFLLTSIGSLLIYQRSHGEQFHLLAVVMAAVATIWLLIISHWSFQLLCLLALLLYDGRRVLAKTVAAGETVVVARSKKRS